MQPAAGGAWRPRARLQGAPRRESGTGGWEQVVGILHTRREVKHGMGPPFSLVPLAAEPCRDATIECRDVGEESTTHKVRAAATPRAQCQAAACFLERERSGGPLWW